MAQKPMEKLIVILGATAVGKTDLSIALAKDLKTEIISGDSLLVYRHFDIGTAKPSLAERQGIPHHLIDICSYRDDYNVATFCREARQLVTKINRAGKIPILAGGTGLYIKALLENYAFQEAPTDLVYRAELESLLAKEGLPFLYALLQQKAPDYAGHLKANDSARIMRALEVLHAGEIPKWQVPTHEVCYDALVIGLARTREHIYARINARVDKMMQAGWLEEVESLLADGIPRTARPMQSLGYKQLNEFLAGECDFSAAVASTKQATRHFAKRQFTWYRKMPYIHWISLENKDFSTAKAELEALVGKRFPAEV